MSGFLWSRKTEHVPCTITVSHRFEELSAHVKFDNGVVVFPGDTVTVQGPEVMAPFGTVVEQTRVAIIERAPFWSRWWTKATGDFGCLELFEFNFSEEVLS